jgi:hypothetical protein
MASSGCGDKCQVVEQLQNVGLNHFVWSKFGKLFL